MWKRKSDEGLWTEQQEEQTDQTAFVPEEEKAREIVEQELDAFLKEDHSRSKKKVHKKWSKKKKITVAVAAALVLVVGSQVLGGQKETLPIVTAIPLAKGEVSSVLTLNGPISGTDSADVVSNLHAEVLSITVKEGDQVKKGDTLALIDKTDVQKSVDIAQNAYDLAVSEYNESIRDTQHNYEKATQDYDAAKLNYNRNKVLFDAGDISASELEGIDNALNDARRAVEGFRVENGKAVPDKSFELKVKSAQFELDQKKKELGDTEVKSPISGTVVRVNSKVGQFADKPEDEKPMFIVENLENLEMEIAVSEYSIGHVRLGQKAEIAADILGEGKAEGEIVAISPTGEEKSGTSERVVPTTIRIKDGNRSGLIAGITARASIVTAKAEDVLCVPQSCLMPGEDGQINIVSVDQASGIVNFIPVKTGVESDLQIEIIPVNEEELSEGMMIVASPQGLSDGMKVITK